LGASVPRLHEDDLAQIERAAGVAELRSMLAVELAKRSVDQRDAVCSFAIALMRPGGSSSETPPVFPWKRTAACGANPASRRSGPFAVAQSAT
jgi:hypothetical protein